MYLFPNSTYYGAHGQSCLRAPFLLLINKAGDPLQPGNVFAVVRQVALKQWGHWMMGKANLHGHWYTVSGSYGSDGLVMEVDKIPKDAVALPEELYQAWAKGGGWNSAGDEAPLLREWALKTFRRQL